MSQAPPALRILKGIAVLTLLAFVAIATLLLSLWLEHKTSVTLPAPTGPLAVGRALFDWTDDQTVDSLAPAPGTKRELLVWIWYPAAASPSSETYEYLPATVRSAVEGDLGVLLGKFLTRDLAKVRAHSRPDADVSSQQQPYPVLLMRAGASLEVWNYSSLAQDLASHGYVVVGFDAPYRTRVVAFPDGRVVKRIPENNPELCLESSGEQRDRCANKLLTAWTADMGFALDRLKQLNASDPSGKFANRLDLERVGVFGHSFGGAAAALFCEKDSRCKAGADVDGALHGSVIQAGIDRPFLFLLSDHSRESDPESGRILADIRSVYGRLPADRRAFVEIRGANHFLFTDDGALLKSRLVLRILRLFGTVGIDGRQLAVTSHCVRTFFDGQLGNARPSPPNLSSPLYPELHNLD